MPRIIFTLLVCLVVAASSYAVAAEKGERILPYQNGDAGGWQAVVSDYSHAPAFLIAVDKMEQRVRIFERKSPLAKMAEYTCTTGQKEGDKLVEGDLKTPEGVYFVEKYINSGLDYTLYGYEAYPLNYPNPVDRLRKKTGFGIWIHGKGIPIVPFDSNGCVGMFNEDIANLKQKPMVGQPVTMGIDVIHETVPDKKRAETAARLVINVQAWAKAWSDRSPQMFDFYDPQAYSMAQGQQFSAFRAQKEGLFKQLPWIKTTVQDIQVLEGPGYWVTWFNQDYQAPNLTTSGTRRLYWQPDASGELRIVGMEWIKGFKSPVLYAETKPVIYTDAGSAAQTQRAEGQNSGKTGMVADASKKARVTPEKQDKKAAESKKEPVRVAQNTKQPTAASEKKQTGASGGAQAGRTSSSSGVDAMLAKEGREFISAWQDAWRRGDLAAYERCYADTAIQGSRTGIRAILEHKKQIWAGGTKITRLELGSISIETTDNGIKAVMLQDYADSRGYADKGIKVLYLEYGQSWRIAREDWKPLVTQ